LRKRHLSKFHGISTYKVQIKRLPREAAAYIMLKRKGQSINNIASVIGRSRSFVYRILKKFHFQDLRKLPRRVRMFHASKMRFLLFKLMDSWQTWILGEGEKPP